MTLIPSTPKYIQKEEVQTRAPDSESTMFKVGGTINFILDHYVRNPGEVVAFAGLEANAPSGWFVCDGRELDRTTYANLFAAIGTQFGDGNAVSTFNIPDFRGKFLRMVDATDIGAAGRDPDAGSRTPLGTGAPGEVGSYQSDEFRSHNHAFIGTGGNAGSGVYASPAASAGYITTTSAGGNESRPKNDYVLYLIKW